MVYYEKKINRKRERKEEEQGEGMYPMYIYILPLYVIDLINNLVRFINQ